MGGLRQPNSRRAEPSVFVPAGEAVMLMFTIPGAPVGKGRPRIARRGRFTSMYTPEKTASYESLVKLAGFEAMAGRELMLGPVSVRMDVCCPIPASWSGKKQEQAATDVIQPTTKPDLDNVTKAIFDGLNGVVWKDDCQVVSMTVEKTYSHAPRVVVSIQDAA
jgi:Holliday junction resolvase RusA-like endonuclease